MPCGGEDPPDFKQVSQVSERDHGRTSSQLECNGTPFSQVSIEKTLQAGFKREACYVYAKALLIIELQLSCPAMQSTCLELLPQGVQLLFYDSKADVLLLDIVATIPDHFKPYLLGYDATENAVPKRAIGIHHPEGNIKRISYANAR